MPQAQPFLVRAPLPALRNSPAPACRLLTGQLVPVPLQHPTRSTECTALINTPAPRYCNTRARACLPGRPALLPVPSAPKYPLTPPRRAST